MFMILVFISFVNTLIVVLTPKQKLIIQREYIGLEDPRPGLKPLSLPVSRIIVTHTNDSEESCETQVREYFNQKFNLTVTL